MNRVPYIFAVAIALALVVARVPESAADCRRVCRSGEVRNAERCCVKRKVRRAPPRPRINHASRCLVHKNQTSCALEGQRLVRLKQYERGHSFLARACTDPGTPRAHMRRACFAMAKLMNAGLIKRRSFGPAWMMNRACLAPGTPRVCGDDDGDTVRNLLDRCPRAKEDKDGYKDHDGCPDKDNDGDRVLDANDACPQLWGAAKSGCPRFGQRIGNAFMFIKKSDKLDYTLPSTRPRIDALVKMLKSNPKLTDLEIRGHALGNEHRDPMLSWRRARVVKQALVRAGISSKRMRVGGYSSIIYPAPIADVVVAGPLSKALSKKQLAQGMLEIKRRADICRFKSGADGTGTWTLWIRADGTVLKTKSGSGALVGTTRGVCIKNVIQRYRFPRSGAVGLMRTTFKTRFP